MRSNIFNSLNMSGAKSISRLGISNKVDRISRSATRSLALEKVKRGNLTKETNPPKSCKVCLVKSDGLKEYKAAQNSKLAVKKSNMKCAVRDGKKKPTSAKHMVIVSKRSSAVRFEKACKYSESVSVKRVKFFSEKSRQFKSFPSSVLISSDEEFSDSEEESEKEDKKECSKRKKIALKRAKMKSITQGVKKTKNKSSNKNKAIKFLCEKLSSGGKRKESPPRELRPRFPYNSLQEWPTARTYRMASLNALAKVHVLYENEGRVVGENMQEADETTLNEYLDDNSDEDKEVKKELKPLISLNQKKNEKSKIPEEKPKTMKKDNNSKKDNNPRKDSTPAKAKILKRGKKRKSPDVEIIDTKICRRMASLNAQAILAASYQLEPKPKRSYKKSEKCYNSSDTETEVDLSIIKKEKEDSDDEVIETPKPTLKKSDQGQKDNAKIPFKDLSSKNAESSTSKKVTKVKATSKKNLTTESEVTIIESGTSTATVTNRSCTVASSAATTKVGMTQYTEVTKVQINTHKDNEIKEERKSERKIKHIVSNEDVAITEMYRYQTKTANGGYCVQMQATTYKPSSKALSSTANLPSTSEARPFAGETSLSSSPNYYGQSSMLPSQVYPNMGPISSAGIDRRLPHHCGASAFSVPRFKHSQHMQFPPNEYGYYQPAGPLIQPIQDQVIHKPVPYHPQPNRHQAPQRPQPSHEGFQSFESRQPRKDKHTIPLQSLTQQQSLVPPISESQSPSQTPPQISRPREDAKSKSLSNNPSPSFQQPSKHVRSPVMPTLYSSQRNFRGYQTQKRESNAFGNYGQPYERKDQSLKLVGYDSRKETGPKLVGYDPAAHASSAGKSASCEASRCSFQSSKDIPLQSSNTHSNDIFKNMSQKPKSWDFKTTHGPSTSYNQSPSSNMYNPGTSSNMSNPGSLSICNPGSSSNFSPYHNSFQKSAHQVNLNEIEHPPRPPSVITIDEDSPRDTKTYIQLEVPKNSHKEKIVVVDVEDDEVEEEHINAKTSNVPSTNIAKTPDRPEKRNILARQVCMPNSVFDRPQYKCTNSKVSETSKIISGCPLNTIEKNTRSSDISKPSFEKPQDRFETKQMPINSDMHKTVNKPLDKSEKKQMHSRNSDMPIISSDRSHGSIEKKQMHYSMNTDMSETTFDKPQHNGDKKHMLSKNKDLPKTICDRPQDKIEKKQIHLKNSEMFMTTFDKPQDKIEKQIHSRNSDTSNLTLDSSKDKIEKKHRQLRNSNSPKKNVDKSQDKIENKYNSSRSDVSKSSFDKLQDKIENKHNHSRNGEKTKASFDKPQHEMEQKHDHSRKSEMPNTMFNKPQSKVESKHNLSKSSDLSQTNFDRSLGKKTHEKNTQLINFDKTKLNFDVEQIHTIPDISIVKVEKISSEDEPDTNISQEKDIPIENKICDEANNDSSDKKKKESAVIRRAKMHGKQRTFRDCYNRPLAQKKKDENLNLSEQHLSKDFQPLVSLSRLVLPKSEKPPAHGWSWEGTPQEKLVYLSNDHPPVLRQCFPSIKHVEGDIISVRDCVFLRSGPRKTDVPFVAKVTALWEMPTNGEMMMSLFWYYRPEHTETYTRIKTAEDEILASNHRDINSVACIEDKCFVLTYSEYCRYRKGMRIFEDSSATLVTPVPDTEDYERKKLLPPFNVSPDLVLFCRRVYDHRTKRLLKNPN